MFYITPGILSPDFTLDPGKGSGKPPRLASMAEFPSTRETSELAITHNTITGAKRVSLAWQPVEHQTSEEQPSCEQPQQDQIDNMSSTRKRNRSNLQQSPKPPRSSGKDPASTPKGRKVAKLGRKHQKSLDSGLAEDDEVNKNVFKALSKDLYGVKDTDYQAFKDGEGVKLEAETADKSDPPPYYDIPHPGYREIDSDKTIEIQNRIRRLAEEHIKVLFLHKDHPDFLAYAEKGLRYGGQIPYHATGLRMEPESAWRKVARTLQVYTLQDSPIWNPTYDYWRDWVLRIARTDKEAGMITVVIKRILYEAPEIGIHRDLVMYIAEIIVRWSIKQEHEGKHANITFEKMWWACTEAVANSNPQEKLFGIDQKKYPELLQRFNIALDWVYKMYDCMASELTVIHDAWTLHVKHDKEFDMEPKEFLTWWMERYWEGKDIPFRSEKKLDDDATIADDSTIDESASVANEDGSPPENETA
ncbi:hypothetical protein ABW19_dt0201583 [Dactylella cylindrospora]|nr:hypothetical protein ABW19_dt0201583 [Dactylella cylindrospora]